MEWLRVFYLLVIVFAVPASFALASSTLTNAAIWQADSGTERTHEVTN